jgi:hypothetical protein
MGCFTCGRLVCLEGTIAVPATVPGGIYTDLFKANAIPDPYYGFNDRDLKWVGRDDWNFKRSFDGNT